MYTVFMKNITLSAPEEVIEQARIVASLKHQTLNELFREWISELSMKQVSRCARPLPPKL
jgi:hypothetical protein